MGELIYFLNHTKKQYFCPICKWGEILLNKYIMEGILEILRYYWNNCKIEIIGEYSINEKLPKHYKEIDWKDFI